MSPERYLHSDELLDRLFGAMTALVRVIAKEHFLDSEDTQLGLTRMLVLRAVQDTGGCRAGEIGQFLNIKPPATSALIDSMEREGLVVREHDSDDKRVVRVRLTPAGLAELAAAEGERRRIMRDRLGVLSDDEIESLIRIQKRVLDAMLADRE